VTADFRLGLWPRLSHLFAAINDNGLDVLSLCSAAQSTNIKSVELAFSKRYGIGPMPRPGLGGEFI